MTKLKFRPIEECWYHGYTLKAICKLANKMEKVEDYFESNNSIYMETRLPFILSLVDNKILKVWDGKFKWRKKFKGSYVLTVSDLDDTSYYLSDS